MSAVLRMAKVAEPTSADREQNSEFSHSLGNVDEHNTDDSPGDQDAEGPAAVQGATGTDEQTWRRMVGWSDPTLSLAGFCVRATHPFR